MSILDHYSLPYLGLKEGWHEYKFDVDDVFFAQFEASPIAKGNLVVSLTLDKRPSFSILDFDIIGTVNVECDRCTADINMPLTGEYQWHVKIGEENKTDDEIMYITVDQATLNLAETIYEMIVLSLPMIYRYDCEKESVRPCNIDILNKIETTDIPSDDSSPESSSPFWEALKNIDFDKH
jgi:uncharacterized protein